MTALVRFAGRKSAGKWAGATLVLLGSIFVSCGYRPARFSDRPPVDHARDDAAVGVPRFRWVPESVYLSEAYLHRPLREAIDVSPYPGAGDVNSVDEVARSTWFHPRLVDVGEMARGPDSAGPPRPPFTVLPDAPMAVASEGFSVSDARGEKYEIVVDPSDRPEMRTGAAAIAARLVWALGLNTPPAFIVKVSAEDFWRSEESTRDAPGILMAGAPPVSGSHRVAALAWPAGLMLGYAPESGVRGDDPNDVVPHEDRRTLRALKVFASWIALGGLGPAKTVDRYWGAPGEGHVVHYFAGLDDSLGAGHVVRVTDLPPAQGGGSSLVRFLTLGLWPNPPPRPTQIEIPALGQLDPDVDPKAFSPSVPYDPADRVTPPDGYWAAKRIASLSPAHIALAVEAGKISDRRAQEAIQQALETRRITVLRYWFGRVTPLELVSVQSTKLVLRDEAVRRELIAPGLTDYHIAFLTSEGKAVGESIVEQAPLAELELPLPDAAVAAARDYVVVRIRARRNRGPFLRPFELHARLFGDRVVIAGIRH
jgi:hypothetical protein